MLKAVAIHNLSSDLLKNTLASFGQAAQWLGDQIFRTG